MQYTLPDGTLLVPAHNKHMTGAGVVNPNVVGINAMEAPAAPAAVPQQAVAPIISAPAEAAAVPAAQVVTMQVQPVQAPAPSFLTPAVPAAVPAAVSVPAPVQTSAPAPVAPNPAPAATFGPGADVGTDPEKEALRKEIEGLKNKRNLEVNQLVAQAVGTPENKAVLDSWVSQNMTGYEQKVLNEIMANGSIAEVQDALNTVITKYNSAANTAAPGAANTASVAASGYVSTPAATSVSSPLSAAEYEHIMLNDQQYKTNPTYAAQVDQRRLAGLAAERNKASQMPRKF